jgi:hypothetical protein
MPQPEQEHERVKGAATKSDNLHSHSPLCYVKLALTTTSGKCYATARTL